MQTKKKAEEELGRRFCRDHDAPLDADRRTASLCQLVLATVGAQELDAALRDIVRGDGDELGWEKPPGKPMRPPKLHSVFSSCGLALNVFGPWRIDPSGLEVGGEGGFRSLSFEEKLCIFGGGRAPHLDAFLTAPGRALAIESKLTEHLGKRPGAVFSDAYDRLKETSHSSWWAMYERLRAEPSAFAYLDAAQLVKHYFGLKAQCAKREIAAATLLYLYWEPLDADDHVELEQHRGEVRHFAEAVADPTIRFAAMTHPQLWREWDSLAEPDWLEEHVSALRERYAISLG
jgi:hypothetical protein